MDETSMDLQVYLKTIEYKRSIGTTQWTVMSIFVTASELVIAFSFQSDNQISSLNALLIRIFGLLIYWFGFVLFARYRALNNQVSNYLVSLEEKNKFEFQKNLVNYFHNKGLSTKDILVVFGILYSLFAISFSLIDFFVK